LRLILFGTERRYARMYDIFLDIGFTLVGGPKLSPGKRLVEILELGPESLPVVQDIVFCERHDTLKSLTDSIGERFKLHISPDSLRAIEEVWNRQFSEAYPLDGASEFLSFLMSGPYGVHLVSNIWKPFFSAFSALFPLAEKHCKTITLSFREGVRKPSVDIFKLALKRANAAPAKSIMVGDSFSKDIVPCCELGMSCVWVNSRPGYESADGQREEKIRPCANFVEAPTLLRAKAAIEEITGEGR